MRHSTLIDKIDAIDSTVFQHGDRWWLMHSGTKGCGPWSLFLWHAPSPFGPWEPHPANPVKTDVTSSRPAGNVFVHEGQLYRPAQDGRYWYGYGLTINRIDRLTPVSFQETVVRRMSADPQGPYPHGFHTLSGYGNQTVVDGKKHTWPLATLIRRFMAKRKWSTGRGFRHSAVTLAPALPLRDKR